MPMTDVMERPKLTLPAEAADMLAQEYSAADVILEYGSGGSTVLAAEMTGKRITSVESDLAWIAMMDRWFMAHPASSPVTLHHGNIGPTTDWGRPASEDQWRKFFNYPLSVWDRADFAHPDVVLIDGRFRIGCLLATMLRIVRPVTVLFDDYAGRKPYRVAEEFAAPKRLAGRMALFRIAPRTPAPQEFLRWVTLMQRPV